MSRAIEQRALLGAVLCATASLAFVAVATSGLDGSARPTVASSLPHADGETDGFDEFPAYLWCPAGLESPLPEEWSATFGGLSAERGQPPAAFAEADWHLYVGHAVGRNALHLDRADVAAARARWLATRRDADLPPRPVDLADPRTAERLAEHARAASARVESVDPARVDFWSLGDEVGFTPFGDPLDFRRAQDVPSTDLALGLLRGPDLDGFLARRALERRELLDALDLASALLRADDPTRALALLGNGPRTPFGGLAASDLVERFDVLEPYPAGSIRAAVLCEREGADDARVLRTVFRESLAATTWQVWEHAVRGGDGVVLWSHAQLAAHPEHARALGRVLAAVRDLRARTGDAAWRVPPRVAVLTDERVDARLWLDAARRQRTSWPRRLAGFEAEHGPAFARRRAWRTALEDAGHICGALELERLLDPRGPSLDLVVVSGVPAASVDARVLDALAAHAERGGRILFDGPGPLLPPAARQALGGALVTAPPGADRYPAERRAPNAARPARLRSALAALARDAGVAQAPARIVARDGRPLLQSWRRAPDGWWLGLAVEGVDTPDERTRLCNWTAGVVAHTDEADLARAHWARVDGPPVRTSDLRVAAGGAAIVWLRES